MDNSPNYKLGDMLKQFPAADLGKMIAKIDRFDETVPDERKAEIEAIEQSEKVTEKIIEENL